MKLLFNASIFFLLFLWQPAVGKLELYVLSLEGEHVNTIGFTEKQATFLIGHVRQVPQLIKNTNQVLPKVKSTIGPYFKKLFKPVSLQYLKQMKKTLQALNTNVFSSKVQSVAAVPRSNPSGLNEFQKIIFVPSTPGTGPLSVTPPSEKDPTTMTVHIAPEFLAESPGNLVEETKEYFREQGQRPGSNSESVIFPVSPPELAWHLLHLFLQQKELTGGHPLWGGPILPPAEEGVASVPPEQRVNLAAAWIYLMETAIGKPDALLGPIPGNKKPLPPRPNKPGILSRLGRKKPSSPPASHPPGPEVVTSHVAATTPAKSRFTLSRFRKKVGKTGLPSSASEITLVGSQSGEHPSKVPGDKHKRSVEDANIPQGSIAKGTTGRKPQRRRFATNRLD